MLFLVDNRIRNVVSVSTYDIPFVRHMTSYMTFFGQNCQIWMDQLQIWHSGVLGSIWVIKVNYIAIGAIMLILWLFYGRFMAVLWPLYGSIMSKWGFV